MLNIDKRFADTKSDARCGNRFKHGHPHPFTKLSNWSFAEAPFPVVILVLGKTFRVTPVFCSESAGGARHEARAPKVWQGIVGHVVDNLRFGMSKVWGIWRQEEMWVLFDAYVKAAL